MRDLLRFVAFAIIATFVHSALAAPTMTLNSPNGGATWQVGTSQTVSWSVSGDTSQISYFVVRLSTNDGSSYTDISSHLSSSTRSFAYTPTSSQVTTTAVCWVRAFNSSGTFLAGAISSDHFTIANAPPTMTLNSPNGGATWQVGTSQTVSWSVSGDTSQISYFVARLSTNDGGSYADISSHLSSSTRSFNYTPTSNQATTTAVCWVRAFNSSGTFLAGAISSDHFTIASPPPTMTLNSPNGGTTWQVGTNQTVSWSVSGDTSQISYFVVRLSTNDGSSYTDISSHLSSSTRSFAYTPTSSQVTTTAVCWVRAFNSSGTFLAGAISSDHFTIANAPPTMTLNSPNGGATWQVGTSQTVSWSVSGDTSQISYFVVRLSTNDGGSYTDISSNLSSSTRSFAYTPTSSQATTTAVCWVRAFDSSGTFLAGAISSDHFTIANAPPTMTLNSPNGGATWQVGTSQTVSWSVGGDTSQISYFVVRLSTNDGGSYTDISSNLSSSTRSFNYTPTSSQATTTAVCWVRAFNSSGTFLAGAISSDHFTIGNAPPGQCNLVIEAGSVSFDPTSVNVGGSFNMSFRVKNLGPAASTATTARRRISSDGILTRNDPGLSPLDVPIPAINAGGQYDFIGPVTIPAGTAAGTYYVGVFADPDNVANQSDFNDDSGVSSGKLTVNGTGSPVLSVSPTNRNVGSTAGTTTFTISNTGGGTLNWTATITSGVGLHLNSPSTGTAAPTSTLSATYDANIGTTPKTGVIRVSAPGASPPQQDVTVVQAVASSSVHYEFSPIASPQKVGISIPVTITARDDNGQQVTGFSATATLSSNPGVGVAPRTIPISNGIWIGSVMLDSAMPRCVVEATSISGSGRSNEFDVTGSGGGISSVSGRVTSRAVSANPITVMISTSPPRQQTLFINSRYVFENVPTGTYTLQATQGSYSSETRTVTVVAGQPVVQDLIVRSGRRPVLFVPGIMGSLAGGSPYGYPYLAAERPFPSDLRIAKGGYGVVNVIGWDTIAGALYEYEVFESPWDWRVPALGPSSNSREIQPAWQLYLMNQIDDAKRISGYNTVDIVAHSTGGLVVRAYLQSDTYAQRNDIDKFVIIATPNEGSAKAYYPWEGGDPWTADSDGRPNPGPTPSEGLYTKVTAKTYKQMIGPLPNGLVTLRGQQLQQFYRFKIAGLSTLLPLFNFLDDGNNPVRPMSWGSQQQELDQLNRDLRGRYRLRGSTKDSSKAETVLFYSKSEDTIDAIRVSGPVGGGVYGQGVPQGNPSTGRIGDGTVRWGSALGAHYVLWNSITAQELSGDHTGLVGKCATAIRDFLNENRQLENRQLGPSTLDGVPQLVVAIRGRSSPLLKDPADRRVGVDPETKQIFDDLPSAETSILSADATITVSEPAAGTYELRVGGNPGEEVEIDITYAHDETAPQRSLKVILSDQPTLVGFVFDPTALEPLALVSPTLIDVVAERAGNVTIVRWTPVGNPESYNVYGRRGSDTRWLLLGSTTDSSFDTQKLWNETGDGEVWYFAVTALSAGGQESGFENIVENRQPLLAAFDVSALIGVAPLNIQLNDRSKGTVTSWAWDFDGDGTIDSTDQNPSCILAKPGQYDITLTVTGRGSEISTEHLLVAVTPARRLANISTRMDVGTGDNVLIGGFILTGSQPKRVLVRGVGPSLTQFGISQPLQDPTLELFGPSGRISSNDNWRSGEDSVAGTGLSPLDDRESAIVTTLEPNQPYTAILRDASGGTGVGLVEVYDLQAAADVTLANISTRGLVKTGDSVMIGGFIVLGNTPSKIIVRAVGPSLVVPSPLADPFLELHDSNGALLEANDNWVDSPNKQAIIDSTIPPSSPLESAIVRLFPPGQYTAIVRDSGTSTGVAVVEAYQVP